MSEALAQEKSTLHGFARHELVPFGHYLVFWGPQKDNGYVISEKEPCFHIGSNPFDRTIGCSSFGRGSQLISMTVDRGTESHLVLANRPVQYICEMLLPDEQQSSIGMFSWVDPFGRCRRELAVDIKIEIGEAFRLRYLNAQGDHVHEVVLFNCPVMLERWD